MALVSQYIAEGGYNYFSALPPTEPDINSSLLATFGEFEFQTEDDPIPRHEYAMRRMWFIPQMVTDD